MKQIIRTLAVAVYIGVITIGPAMAAESPDWSEFYGGLHIGKIVNDTQYTIFDTSIGGINSTPNSFRSAVGGAQVGYNLDLGRYVLGIEADVSGPEVDGNAFCPNPSYTCGLSIKRAVTLRPRIGIKASNFLLYFTGGLAAVETYTYAVGGDSNTKSGSRIWRLGRVYGGGVEYLLPDKYFSKRVSIRLEGLYTNLNPSVEKIFGDDTNTKIKFRSLRAGINVHF